MSDIRKLVVMEKVGSIDRSRECAQIVPEAVAIAEEALHLDVGVLPDGDGSREQSSPLWGQRHQTAAAVGRIRRDFDQSAALEGLESRRQGGPIHCEQRRHGRHTSWFRAVQGHQERKLPVC